MFSITYVRTHTWKLRTCTCGGMSPSRHLGADNFSRTLPPVPSASDAARARGKASRRLTCYIHIQLYIYIYIYIDIEMYLYACYVRHEDPSARRASSRSARWPIYIYIYIHYYYYYYCIHYMTYIYIYICMYIYIYTHICRVYIYNIIYYIMIYDITLHYIVVYAWRVREVGGVLMSCWAPLSAKSMEAYRYR